MYFDAAVAFVTKFFTFIQIGPVNTVLLTSKVRGIYIFKFCGLVFNSYFVKCTLDWFKTFFPQTSLYVRYYFKKGKTSSPFMECPVWKMKGYIVCSEKIVSKCCNQKRTLINGSIYWLCTKIAPKEPQLTRTTFLNILLILCLTW